MVLGISDSDFFQRRYPVKMGTSSLDLQDVASVEEAGEYIPIKLLSFFVLHINFLVFA